MLLRCFIAIRIAVDESAAPVYTPFSIGRFSYFRSRQHQWRRHGRCRRRLTHIGAGETQSDFEVVKKILLDGPKNGYQSAQRLFAE